MDYVFGSVLRLVLVFLVLISYDIACQWFVHLFTRMNRDWPDEIKQIRPMRIVPAIPKLHYSMHETAGHEPFSLNLMPGAGLSDCECPERVWSPHNALGNSTKTQGPGSRHDVLDDHFGFWNWLKYKNIGTTLVRKYKAAVAERNVQVEGHRGLSASLNQSVIQKWERMCLEWEQDLGFPKKKKNPYHVEDSREFCLTQIRRLLTMSLVADISEARVKKQLSHEEEARLKSGGIALNRTSAASFIALGLEIEEYQ